MISGDESFLSAYMDGQLDPDQRQWVESALASNPRLAEQLRELTVVRDLVAGLARETSDDVTPQVMEQIRARRAILNGRPEGRSHGIRRFRALHDSWRPGRERRVAVAGILTAAAGVIVVISLAISHTLPLDRAHPAAGPARAGAMARANLTTTRIDAGATTETREARPYSSHTSRSNAVAAGTAESRAEARIGPVAESTGSARSHDLEHYRQLLDNPNLRRSFLIRSGRDGKGEQDVASAVERTTRYGFFKTTVSQGIVIDPRHPDQATVFILLVNPQELDRLRDQLKVAFSDLEENPVDPEIATQLADIGHVQAFYPAAMAEVSIPREGLALRTRVAGAAENTGPPDLSKTPTRRERPTIEQEQSAKRLAAARFGLRPDNHPGAARTPAPASKVAEVQHASGPVRGHPLEPTPGNGDGRSLAGAASTARPSEATEEQIVVFVWVLG